MTLKTNLSNGFRRRRQRPIGPLDSRNPAPRRRHGLTPIQIDAMLRAQGYACALCGSQDPGDVSFAVDHDHRHHPGDFGCALCVRALICRSCNLALGYAKDDARLLRRMAEYLDWHDRTRRW